MKILLSYDGGEPAGRALSTAAAIAKALGAALDVIRVVPSHPDRSPIDPLADRPDHDAVLDVAQTRLADLGLRCRLLEATGDPATEIEKAARDGRYDMIVLGPRAGETPRRTRRDSVSQHVATHADATVVIAR